MSKRWKKQPEFTEEELHERGLFLRFKRTSLSKTQEELADGDLSSSTIGNIELNKGSFTEKAVSIYAEKLGIHYEDIPKLIVEKKKKDHEERELLKFKISSIEDLSFSTKPKIALRQLKKITKAHKIPDTLDYLIEYIKGMIALESDQLNQAKIHLQKSLHLNEQNHDNYNPHIYNQLGRVFYHQNDFEKAIRATELGIELLAKANKKNERWYVLLINKANYLERTGRIDEASNVLNELWKEKQKINNMEVILNIYDLQGTIYRKKKLFDDGINTLQKGILLARQHNNIARSAELWTTLGSIYIDLKKYTDAEHALQTASFIGAKNSDLIFPVQIKLGELYIKLGNLDRAFRILDSSLDDDSKINVFRLIQKRIALADISYKQEKLQDAIEQLNLALADAKQHKLHAYESEIYSRLGQCWENINEEKFVDAAVNYYKTQQKIQGGTFYDV